MSDLTSIIFSCIIGWCIGHALIITLKFIYVKVINRKKLTPFERAGYTKETKFKVLRDDCTFDKGDIVALGEDEGSECIIFKTEDGRWNWLYLPNMTPKYRHEELEVHEEEV